MRSRAQTVVRLAALLAIFGLVLGVGRYALRAARLRHAKTALASVHKCLFGAPLLPGEHPSGRMHKITLGEPPKDWPARCAKYTSDYAETRAAIDGDAFDFNTANLIELGAIEASPYAFDAFWEAAGVSAESDMPADLPLAPPALVVDDDKTPALLAHGDLIGASVDVVPAGDVHLLSSTHLCTARAPLTKMQCDRVQSRAMASTLWPGSEPGGPLLEGLAVPWTTSSIVRLDTRDEIAPTEGRTMTAYGLKDGSVAVLEREAHGGAGPLDSYFFARDAKQPRRDTHLVFPPTTQVRLFGDAIFAFTPQSAGSTGLMRLPVDATRLEVLDVLPGDSDQPLGACYTNTALALHGRVEGFVVFLREHDHSPVHRYALAEAAANVSRSYACGADDFTVTDVEHTDHTTIRTVRCTEAGCGAVEQVTVGAMLEGRPDQTRPSAHRDDVVATSIGAGKVLVVWRSQSRGLRFRIGAPADLAHAPDHVLYDDRISDGAPFATSMLQDTMVLAPRYDGVVVALQTMGTTDGVKAFRITVDGVVTSLQ